MENTKKLHNNDPLQPLTLCLDSAQIRQLLAKMCIRDSKKPLQSHYPWLILRLARWKEVSVLLQKNYIERSQTNWNYLLDVYKRQGSQR